MEAIQENLNTSWHSYPKLWALGHANIKELLFDEVLVEEKLDGSQFSFGVFNGELKCRSKGCVLNMYAPEKMFNKAVDYCKSIQHLLMDGWTYRGEYLASPKHNTLAYERTPKNYIMLFDINTGHEVYLDPEAKKIEAERIGLECMPSFYQGKINSSEEIRELLDTVSILGGQKVEGIVIKNYKRFGTDGKALLGKFVSEAFKEIHTTSWKESNPGQNDIIQRIINKYRTAARWAKAVQHLKEAGKLENSPRDIGLLFKEVGTDILSECEAEIKQELFDWSWKAINRGVTSGMPEWYKEELMKLQFNSTENTNSREVK